MGAIPQEEVAAMLNCQVDIILVTYLGVPITGRRPRWQDWDGFFQKVRRRLSSWKAQHLILGGPYNSGEFCFVRSADALDVHF